MPLLLRAAADSPEESDSCSKAAIVNISSILGSVGENKTGGMYGYRPSKVSDVVCTRLFSAQSHELSRFDPGLCDTIYRDVMCMYVYIYYHIVWILYGISPL